MAALKFKCTVTSKTVMENGNELPIVPDSIRMDSISKIRMDFGIYSIGETKVTVDKTDDTTILDVTCTDCTYSSTLGTMTEPEAVRYIDTAIQCNVLKDGNPVEVKLEFGKDYTFTDFNADEFGDLVFEKYAYDNSNALFELIFSGTGRGPKTMYNAFIYCIKEMFLKGEVRLLQNSDTAIEDSVGLEFVCYSEHCGCIIVKAVDNVAKLACGRDDRSKPWTLRVKEGYPMLNEINEFTRKYVNDVAIYPGTGNGHFATATIGKEVLTYNDKEEGSNV